MTDRSMGWRAWRFRPRLVTTAAAVAFCVLTVALGNWQLRRASEKEFVQTQREARARAAPVALPATRVDGEAWAWRRVVVQGRFVGPRTILLDNRTRDGRAGYEVVTPLRIAGGDLCVLVNRGWTAQGRTRAELPEVRTPSGPVQVEGIAVVPPTHVFQLGGSDPAGRVWQHLDLARYRAWSELPLQPVVLLQTGGADDGLLRDWPPPESDAARHTAYAVQWYIFALIAAILYVALNLKRDRDA
jgi:surfeit locus 1 family protein